MASAGATIPECVLILDFFLCCAWAAMGRHTKSGTPNCAKVSYPVTPNRKNVKGIINGLTLFRYNVRKV